MAIPANPARAMFPMATQAIAQTAQTASGAAIPAGLAHLYRTRRKELRRRDPALYRLARAAFALSQGNTRALPELLSADPNRLVAALHNYGLGKSFGYFKAQAQQNPWLRQFVSHGPYSHGKALQRMGNQGPIGPKGFAISSSDFREMAGMHEQRLRRSLGTSFDRAVSQSRLPQRGSPIQQALQFARGADIQLEDFMPLAGIFMPDKTTGGRRD